jgi:hypothetical protein
MAAMAGFDFLELGDDVFRKSFFTAPPPRSDSSTTADSLNYADNLPSSEFIGMEEPHGSFEQFLSLGDVRGAVDQLLKSGSAGPATHAKAHLREEKDHPKDTRTTLMIRNVPRKYTQQQLLVDLIAAYDFTGWVDFFYLPTDLGTCRNLGYCFINLATPEHATAVKTALHKRRLSSGAKSGLSIGYADFQGLEENVRNVRRSLMHRIKNRDYRPLLADENGELVPITH